MKLKPPDLLAYALRHYAGQCKVHDARNCYVDSKRGKDGAEGTVTLHVPDEILLALRGPPADERFKLLLVTVPREVEERSRSLIVLAGEA